MTIYEKLAAPFPPEAIDWRVGPTTADKSRGQALCYVDARVVMNRFDDVCGPSGWCNRYTATVGTTVCEIGVRDPDLKEWIFKADGAGASDVEAEKGALSDAFKRAAVRWGVGRYLYDLSPPWVALKAQGKSWVIDPSELPKLHALLSGGRPMAQAPSARPAPSAQGTRQITPQEWVNASKSTIDTFRTTRELETWEQKPTIKAKLDWLATAEADLFEDMEGFIGIKRKKLAAMVSA